MAPRHDGTHGAFGAHTSHGSDTARDSHGSRSASSHS
jgi:hypothetical protein